MKADLVDGNLSFVRSGGTEFSNRRVKRCERKRLLLELDIGTGLETPVGSVSCHYMVVLE